MLVIVSSLVVAASASFASVGGTSTSQRRFVLAAGHASPVASLTPGAARREDMSSRGRSTAEVAVGLNRAEWKRKVAETRASGVTAVRVRHILVQSDELAAELRNALRNGQRFSELAAAASACAATREKGGEVGWSGVNDEHLDEILPRPVRAAAMLMQPGDIRIEPSPLGVHLFEVEDVFQTLQVTSDPRTRGLPGTGLKPRPLIELLRASRDDTRSFKQLLVAGDDDGATTTAADGKRGGSSAAAAAGVAGAAAAAAAAAIVSPEDGDDGSGELARTAAPTLRYSMESMGCQMNSADAERMEGQLRALGFTEASEPREAQVVVLNTCSIREHAQAKVYSYLGPHAQRKQRGEDVAIVVAGCVAQQEGEELLRRACPPPRCHVATLPRRHAATLPRRHAATLPRRHTRRVMCGVPYTTWSRRAPHTSTC